MERSHLEWIARKIDELYKKEGLTLEKLSFKTIELEEENPQKYCGSSRTNIIKLRNCETKEPRPRTLAAIAKALGMPDDYFLPTVRTMDEKAIHDYAMEYLLTHQINVDQPLDDVINDVLYEAYDVDLQPLIHYFRFRGCEIEYDVTDEILLQDAEKSLIHTKSKKKENPKITKKYEDEIAELETKLKSIPIPDEYDADLSELDKFYELQALLNEKKQAFQEYKNAYSTIPTKAEIHYHAKDNAINMALAKNNPLKEVPLIARISRPAVLFKDADEPTALPPIEISIYRFVEACKQMDALANFLLEL